MRGASHGRLLAELALVRVARLENLTDLSELIHRVSTVESRSPLLPRTAAPGVKKKLVENKTIIDEQGDVSNQVQEHWRELAKSNSEEQLTGFSQLHQGNSVDLPTEDHVESAQAAVTSAAVEGRVGHSLLPEALDCTSHDTIEPASAAYPHGPHDSAQLELTKIHQVWEELVKKVGTNLGIRLSQTAPIAVEGSDVLVIAARPGYNSVADVCGTAEAKDKIEQCLHRLLRRPVTVRYDRSTDSRQEGSAPESESGAGRTADVLTADPMVQQVIELFEARPLHVEYDDGRDSMPV
jgi:DNA polymerase-3 subunit gamma/tau